MQLAEVIQQLDDTLAQIIEDPTQRQVERTWLLVDVLDIAPETLHREPELEVSMTARQKLWNLAFQRTVERMPLQYLLGYGGFYGRLFEVSPAVLIPRPETEHLLAWAVEQVRQNGLASALDLGTGSGCLAVSLSIECSPLAVSATDISPEALAVAQRNAEAHQAQVSFYEGSWADPLPPETHFDLVISNPPYIEPNERDTLAPEVLQEPSTALFAPESVDTLYDTLLGVIASRLSERGVYGIEIGAGQAERLSRIARGHGLSADIIEDYSNIPRIIYGRKH